MGSPQDSRFYRAKTYQRNKSATCRRSGSSRFIGQQRVSKAVRKFHPHSQGYSAQAPQCHPFKKLRIFWRGFGRFPSRISVCTTRHDILWPRFKHEGLASHRPAYALYTLGNNIGRPAYCFLLRTTFAHIRNRSKEVLINKTSQPAPARRTQISIPGPVNHESITTDFIVPTRRRP